ncbi:hypothetical protein L249_6168 [Ophiocordyceps polyrhachis-furcata BCC 54312]|uniref:CENP-V/GFA domain-containing protein n=1 Tax=Ophiocordyceps polyrhachis-furcata BCC 54312 TaxID=1330021 RepID=A0A367LJ33_9HYPO|nr:hypothetical protein L249_6168 [Ophiocordyceps polyrhachis-furcata BCC 54312]
MTSSNPKKLHGSCLCGNITYELTGEPDFSNLCYCTSCRKATGALSMANSLFKKENFQLLTGADHLRTYHDGSCDSGGALERGFCGTCGSNMMIEHKSKLPDKLIIPMGTSDVRPSDWVPNAEFFCKWKPTWVTTPEDSKKYDEQF